MLSKNNVNKNGNNNTNLSISNEDNELESCCQLENDNFSKNEKIKSYKRGKYRKLDPIYFYYDINSKTYRYTCINKNSNTKIIFKCSYTKFLSKGEYFIKPLRLH